MPDEYKRVKGPETSIRKVVGEWNTSDKSSSFLYFPCELSQLEKSVKLCGSRQPSMHDGQADLKLSGALAVLLIQIRTETQVY